MAKPGIFHKPVEKYLAELAIRSSPHPVLKAMEEEAHRRSFPMIGPEVGRFFFQLAKLTQPKRILELGSGFGYSAMWWALAAPDAEIHLTEFQEANLASAIEYATKAGVAHQFRCHAGDALASARKLEGPWDIIFVDIDKDDYPHALEFAAGALRPGGILLIDNMIWGGCVAQEEGERDITTEAIINTTNAAYDNPAWSTSLIPLRDGVLMAIRNE